MDVSGVLKGVEGNADKIGAVLGAWSSASVYGGDGMTGINAMIQGLATSPHIPDIGHVGQVLFGSGAQGQLFKSAITASVVGWLMKEIDVHPTIGRVGNLVMKLGMGATGGIVATTLLIFAGREHSTPPGQPYAGHDGYPRGAGYSPTFRQNGGYFTMPNVPPATPTLPTILPGSPRP